jgi:hypothetical protein
MEPREVSEYIDDQFDRVVEMIYREWAEEGKIDLSAVTEDEEIVALHERFWASPVGSEIILWKHKKGTEVTEKQLTFANLCRQK